MTPDPHHHELLRALLDGSLQPEQSTELLEALRADPKFLEEVGESLAVDRLLEIAAEPELEQARFSAEISQRIQTAPQAEHFARSVRHRLKPKRTPFSRLALPIAAGLVLLATGSWLFLQDHALARVSGLSDVTWPLESGLQRGDVIEQNQTITIDSGLLELQLPRRGNIILEGPATLTALGNKEFTLDQGRATFTITPGGKGLTVHTPHGKVVDIGTSFGLDIAETSGDLHVIQGIVEFTHPQAPKQTLVAGGSLRSDRSATNGIPFAGHDFVQQIPDKPSASAAYAHWPCQEGGGTTSAPTGTASDDPLLLKATPAGKLPSWVTVEGRTGLSFDGESSYAQTAWPGLLGDTPRTVALWVRIPKEWREDDGGALVSWGRFEWRQPNLFFELGLNKDPARGPLGAPQLDTYGSIATGTVSLCDDQWHHLAVTTYQRGDSASSTQVLFYLDGRLINSSPRVIPRIETVASGGDRGVVVGRSAQSMYDDIPDPQSVLRGIISDVAIFPQAMSGQEIRRFMDSRRPE